MYQVDDKDKVVELKDVPQFSVGSPMPILLCDEQKTYLSYLIHYEIDYENPKPEYFERKGEAIAIVEFELCSNKRFGSPNDEAINGHPLYSIGLGSYGVYEIQNSSWLRQLEIMNRVHHNHRPETFEKYKHFIFTFHDSMFECIAQSFKIDIHSGSLESCLTEMQKRLFFEMY
jgi:hypothetical protein